jgi:DNA (cytosine-5)-methyltransferase 1
MDELRLIDTFSGIGGFSYAAEKLVGGFKTVAFVECEPYCQKVLKKHWPDVPIYEDIKSYQPEPYSADVICGGFPCQSISNAGKREGITETSQSGLWYELYRVICLLQPRYIVLENVSAILSRGLGIVLGNLAQAGYDTEWACIKASDLGGSHKRDRWFAVSYVANTNSEGLQRLRAKHELQESSEEREACWSPSRITLKQDWRRYLSKPLLSRGDDVIPNWIHRSKRIKALGNSLLPAVAAIPLQRVLDLHNVTMCK